MTLEEFFEENDRLVGSVRVETNPGDSSAYDWRGIFGTPVDPIVAADTTGNIILHITRAKLAEDRSMAQSMLSAARASGRLKPDEPCYWVIDDAGYTLMRGERPDDSGTRV